MVASCSPLVWGFILAGCGWESPAQQDRGDPLSPHGARGKPQLLGAKAKLLAEHPRCSLTAAALPWHQLSISRSSAAHGTAPNHVAALRGLMFASVLTFLGFSQHCPGCAPGEEDVVVVTVG